MVTNIVAIFIIICVLGTQGSVIHEEHSYLFIPAIRTFLKNPDTLIGTFGLTREKRDADGVWDFDHSFSGVTLQIKYKDPANWWKGGHAHFEVQDLENLQLNCTQKIPYCKFILPLGITRYVNFDVTFDGGAAPWDGRFNLKLEYTLQHTIEEKGIFEFNHRQVGNQWISDISNKQNGGESGSRIFPVMEFQVKTDGSDMSTATFNSDLFKNVKLDIKLDSDENLNAIMAGNILGEAVTVTLDGTRNSADNQVNGTLAVDIGNKKYKLLVENKRGLEKQLNMKLTADGDLLNGKPLELTLTRNGTEWTVFSGNLKITHDICSRFNSEKSCYMFGWNIDLANGIKVHLTQDDNIFRGGPAISCIMNSAYKSQLELIERIHCLIYMVFSHTEIKYRSNSNWDKILVKVAAKSLNSRIQDINVVDIKVKRELTGDGNSKTTLLYRLGPRTYFSDRGINHMIIVQVEKLDADTKRFTVLVKQKNLVYEKKDWVWVSKDVLKYVNNISTKTLLHNGYKELAMTMESKLDLNKNSTIHKIVCKDPNSIHMYIHCLEHIEANVDFKLNLEEPWRMHLLANISKDGMDIVNAKVDTKSHDLQTPHIFHLWAPRILPASLDAEFKNVGNNVIGKVSLNNKELIMADFHPSGRSITQNITLSDGRAFTTIFKWGNDINWINNNIELGLNGTETKLGSKFEWNLGSQGGNWTLDVVGKNKRWGDYNMLRTGMYADNNGVWTIDVDGTALWKGNNVETDIFIQLDTLKVGNGKSDAITAKLIKIVDGNKYEVNVTDGKMALRDLLKIGEFVTDFSY